MPNFVVPQTKAVYLCDDVLGDTASQKVHLLGIFNAIRPAADAMYPYPMDEFCVFAQLVGGLGETPVYLEIVEAASETIIYEFPEQRLQFLSRLSTVSACFRVHDCTFPRPGVYIVEIFCQNTLVDDRAFRLLNGQNHE